MYYSTIIHIHIKGYLIMEKRIERPAYMSELEAFRDDRGHVKVITGIRRCGKSTLLLQFMDRLRSQGVPEDGMLLINLESSEYDRIRNHSDLNAFLKDRVPTKGRFYLFLDEIQRVKDWERTVNALMVDTEADIYITGSNAHLLSTDLTTYLTGRYVEVRMLPLSFREYSELRGNGRRPDNVFREYFQTGGFPGIDPAAGKHAVSTLLEDLYSSIVYRDMVSRGNIRKPEDLGKLVTYLMLNIGNRPTIGNGEEVSTEVNLLDYEGDLYGKHIVVEFVARLRDEQRFVSRQELAAQLQKDEVRTRELLHMN